MRGGLNYQCNDHREAVKQIIEINDILPFMCEDGKKFDDKDLYRNINPATLQLTARIDFIKPCGRNFRDKDKVLNLLEEIQEGIEAETEIKHSSDRRNNNYFKFNHDASTRNDNDNKDGNR